MKMLPYLLINLVMVGGGIVVYDQLKSDDAAPTVQTGAIDPVDIASLEDRIIERIGDRSPALRATGTDPRVTARLDALEKQVGATPSSPAPIEAGGDGDAGFARPDPIAAADEPSDEEVKRIRKIMERAEQMRREERELQRLDTMLERLEINLTPPQKKKFISAQRDMRDKMGQVWRNARTAGGGDREAMRQAGMEGMTAVREEFTAEITKFMSVGDVHKITEEGSGMMRAFGGFGRDGGGRRGR